MSTLPAEQLIRLNDQWEIEKDAYTFRQFPSLGEVSWFETMAPSPRKLGGLGGDHDGDTASGNAIFSKEGKEEIKKHFNSREAYIGAGGKLKDSPFTETVERVFYALTGI
jgi:hypothetical protein